MIEEKTEPMAFPGIQESKWIPHEYGVDNGFEYVHEKIMPYCIYSGTMIRGDYEGFGKMIFTIKGNHALYPPGFYYVGQWRQGKMWGKGKLYNEKEKLVFEGDFNDDDWEYGTHYNLDKNCFSQQRHAQYKSILTLVAKVKFIFDFKYWQSFTGTYIAAMTWSDQSLGTLKIGNGDEFVSLMTNNGPTTNSYKYKNKSVGLSQEGQIKYLDSNGDFKALTHVLVEAQEMYPGQEYELFLQRWFFQSRVIYIPFRLTMLPEVIVPKGNNQFDCYFAAALLYTGQMKDNQYHGLGTLTNLMSNNMPRFNPRIPGNFLDLREIQRNNQWRVFEGSFVEGSWDDKKPGKVLLTNGWSLFFEETIAFKIGHSKGILSRQIMIQHQNGRLTTETEAFHVTAKQFKLQVVSQVLHH